MLIKVFDKWINPDRILYLKKDTDALAIFTDGGTAAFEGKTIEELAEEIGKQALYLEKTNLLHYFAGLAMQASLSHVQNQIQLGAGKVEAIKEIALDSLKMADEMVKESYGR